MRRRTSYKVIVNHRPSNFFTKALLQVGLLKAFKCYTIRKTFTLKGLQRLESAFSQSGLNIKGWNGLNALQESLKDNNRIIEKHRTDFNKIIAVAIAPYSDKFPSNICKQLATLPDKEIKAIMLFIINAIVEDLGCIHRVAKMVEQFFESKNN